MKKFSLVLFNIAFAAIVSACVMPPLTVPEDMACSDVLGCIHVAADEEIVVAVMAPLSGPNALKGDEVTNAVELAIEDYGDVLGHKIAWVTEDSMCTREGGLTAAQQIAADPSVVGIVGPRCSSAAIAALPIISRAGLSMISPSNTSPVLTELNRDKGGVWEPGYYRTAHNDLLQGALAAEFAFHEMGVRTAATIHDGSSYSDSLQQVMAEKFIAFGGEITHQGVISIGDTDMRKLLVEIAADQPDLLFLPVSVHESVFILKQVKAIPGLVNSRLFSADASLSSNILGEAGERALGLVLTGPHVDNQRHDALLLRWERMFGDQPPSGFHSHAYDATIMLMTAVAAVARGDSEGNLLIGRQAIRDYLTNLEGFLGISGVISCNPTGDCATGDGLAVFQIEDLTSWPPAVVYTSVGQ